MRVEYVTHSGSDHLVVSAARVSFDKKSVPVCFDYVEFDGGIVSVPRIDDRDTKLLKYLAEHGHWSPFAHPVVTMRWTAPIFIARQLAKHQVGMTWNEISRRYVKTEPELWFPKVYRNAAENVKQGSSQDEFKHWKVFEVEAEARILVNMYKDLLNEGLCPEQARMFLPQNTLTSWMWTGSLAAWARVFKQRSDPSAQQEVQELMPHLAYIMQRLFPVSWPELTY